MRVLVPVDGSDSSLAALRFVIDKLVPAGAGRELHLLNVQPALPPSASRFTDSNVVRDYHQAERVQDLAAPHKRLAPDGGANTSEPATGTPANKRKKVA